MTKEGERKMNKAEKAPDKTAAGMEVLTRAHTLLGYSEKLKGLSPEEFKVEFQHFREMVKESRKQCEQDFPDQMQEISVIFNLQEFLYNEHGLNFGTLSFGSPGEKGKFVENLTEYQFLLADFIEKNKNSEYLEEFWRYFGRMAYRGGMRGHEVEALRSGILGQVALKHLFNSMNIPVRSATPHEDAFYKIDAFIDDGPEIGSIQVKTSRELEELTIIGKQDKFALPAFEWIEDDENKIFFTKLARQIKSFWLKTDEYAKAVGKPVNAYIILLPRHEIDGVTGLPSDALVGDFQKKISEFSANPKEDIVFPELEIRPGESNKKAKSRHSYEMMAEDKAKFDPSTQASLAKYLKGEELSSDEKTRLRNERSRWWKEKFGSNFNQWGGGKIIIRPKVKQIKRREFY